MKVKTKQMIIKQINVNQSMNQIHIKLLDNEFDLINKRGLLYEAKSLTNVDLFDVNNSINKKGLFIMSKKQNDKVTKDNFDSFDIKSYEDKINDLTKRIDEKDVVIVNLKTELDSKDELILDLQVKLEKQSKIKDGRKSQVLNLLIENESISILELASSINISTKNVSSQLTYLRSDGYKIFTDHNGRKVLMNKPVVESDSTDDDKSVVEDEIVK